MKVRIISAQHKVSCCFVDFRIVRAGCDVCCVLIVFVCVCVCVGKRERERETTYESPSRKECWHHPSNCNDQDHRPRKHRSVYPCAAQFRADVFQSRYRSQDHELNSRYSCRATNCLPSPQPFEGLTLQTYWRERESRTAVHHLRDDTESTCVRIGQIE